MVEQNLLQQSTFIGSPSQLLSKVSSNSFILNVYDIIFLRSTRSEILQSLPFSPCLTPFYFMINSFTHVTNDRCGHLSEEFPSLSWVFEHLVTSRWQCFNLAKGVSHSQQTWTASGLTLLEFALYVLCL